MITNGEVGDHLHNEVGKVKYLKFFLCTPERLYGLVEVWLHSLIASMEVNG